jgi:hypothetical protein
MDHLVHQIELSHLYRSQTRKQLRFAFLEFLFRDLVQLAAHLELEQLLFDHGVVVQFLIGHLLDLAEYELEAVDRRQ